MSITSTITTIIASLGGSALVSSVIIKWSSNLIQSRITKEWDHRYSRELEQIKAKLTGNNEIIKSSISNLATSNQKLLDKQLIAVDEIWRNILSIRNFTERTVIFYSAFPPSSYEQMEPLMRIFPHDEKDYDQLANVSIEYHRPFVGEYIWGLYSLYRNFHLRLQFFFDKGKQENNIKPWYKDVQLVEMVGGFTEKEELDILDVTKIGILNELVKRMEQKILFEIDKLISGTHFTQKNIQEARKLLDLVSMNSIEDLSNIARNKYSKNTSFKNIGI